MRLEAAIEKGQRLLVEGRDQENFEFLKKAVQRFPNDPEIRLLYATCLLTVWPDEAVWQAAKAIELESDDPILLTRAARVMFHMGRVETARSYAARAREFAQPEFVLMSALTNLEGFIAAFDGEDEFAAGKLRFAMDSEPDREEFARDLAKFLADRGKTKEAMDVIDQALEVAKEREQLEHLRDEISGRPAPDGD